jgi:hypothetical protein
MSKLSKVALILVIALIAIGARQVTSPPTQDLEVEPATAPLPGTPQEVARDSDPGPDWIALSREWLYRNP